MQRLYVRHTLYYYLFILLAFFMPLWEKAVPVIIMMIVITWVTGFNYQKRFSRIKNKVSNRYLLSFAGLYILYLIGTLYSTNLSGKSGALFDLEVKLSLVVFPVIFSTVDFTRIKNDYISKVLDYFVLGCVVSTLIILINSILIYLDNGRTDVFFYTRLSMDFHPTYIAMYLNFSIAIMLYRLIFTGIRTATLKYLILFIIVYLEIIVVLLSSKAGIIGLILILIALIIIISAKVKVKMYKKLSLVFLSLATVIVAILVFPASHNRFFEAKDAFADDYRKTESNTDGKISRILIWQSSIEIIQEKFLFGAGTGDVIPELKHTYEIKGLKDASVNKLNAHNQYFQTAIALGLPGIVFLVMSLFYPAIVSFQRNKILYLLFLILIIFNMLTESILERQEGVTFYAYFNALLFCSAFSGECVFRKVNSLKS